MIIFHYIKGEKIRRTRARTNRRGEGGGRVSWWMSWLEYMMLWGIDITFTAQHYYGINNKPESTDLVRIIHPSFPLDFEVLFPVCDIFI